MGISHVLNKQITSSFVIMSILALSVFASLNLVQPTRAATQIATLTSCITGQPQWITYDSANRIGWISSGISTSNLYKVNLLTVITQVCLAVTPYTSLLGNTCGGSLAAGPQATVVLGSNLYATSWYSTNCIGVSQIRESDGTVLNTWTYTTGTGPQDAQGIVTDGTYLYVCAQGTILKLTTSGVYSVLHTIVGDCVNMILVGSILWFSEGGSGIGKINTDGTGFAEYGCGGCGSAYFLASVSGNIWFTDSSQHKLWSYIGSAFSSYSPPGMTTTGPYGIHYNLGTGQLWVDGYANLESCPFTVATTTFGSCTSTTKKPFQSFSDNSNNDWIMALGSTDLIEITGATTTTTTSTSTTTTTTCTQYYVNPPTDSNPYCPASAWLPTLQIDSIVVAGPWPFHLTTADSVIVNGYLWWPTSGPMSVKNLTLIVGTYQFPSGFTFGIPTLVSLGSTKTGWLCEDTIKVIQSPTQCNQAFGPISYEVFNATISTSTHFTLYDLRFSAFGNPVLTPVGANYVPVWPFSNDQWVWRA